MSPGTNKEIQDTSKVCIRVNVSTVLINKCAKPRLQKRLHLPYKTVVSYRVRNRVLGLYVLSNMYQLFNNCVYEVQYIRSEKIKTGKGSFPKLRHSLFLYSLYVSKGLTETTTYNGYNLYCETICQSVI